MSRILILVSSTDGHTREICDAIRAELQSAGHNVTQCEIEDAAKLNPADFDHTLIGARIRYGKHCPRVIDFINRHHTTLTAQRGALFSVNIVARKPEKNTPATNPYFKKLLKQIRWRPAYVEVFAGKLDYPRYNSFDRMMIRFIMLLTKGPTDPSAVVDFTDWKAVQAFGRKLAAAYAP
jgi:menaquinone-dependent protoporphyrinogen oxidase